MKIEDPRTLAVGQKIRISFEATFRQVDPCFLHFDRPGISANNTHRLDGLTIEVIEPEYLDNQAYLAANGTIWLYRMETLSRPPRWEMAGSSLDYDFDVPLRPLRRLVPEG